MDENTYTLASIPGEALEPPKPSTNHQASFAFDHLPSQTMSNVELLIDGSPLATHIGTPATAVTPYHEAKPAATDEGNTSDETLQPRGSPSHQPDRALQQGEVDAAERSTNRVAASTIHLGVNSEQQRLRSTLSDARHRPTKMNISNTYAAAPEHGGASSTPEFTDPVVTTPEGSSLLSHPHMPLVGPHGHMSTQLPSHLPEQVNHYGTSYPANLHPQELSALQLNANMFYPPGYSTSPFEGQFSNYQEAQLLAYPGATDYSHNPALGSMMMNPYAHRMGAGPSHEHYGANHDHYGHPVKFVHPSQLANSAVQEYGTNAFNQGPSLAKKRAIDTITIDDSTSSSDTDQDKKASSVPYKKAKTQLMPDTASSILDLTKNDPVVEAVVPAAVALKRQKDDNRLICMGRVESAFALANRVPNPGHIPERLDYWPKMKSSIRGAGHDSGLFYILTDPAGNDYGKLDLYTSRALRNVEAICAAKLNRKFALDKLSISIKKRPVGPGEAAGAPFDGVKAHLYLEFDLIVPKAIAEKVYAAMQKYDIQLVPGTSGKIQNFSTDNANEEAEDLENWAPPVDLTHTARSDNVEREALNLINSLATSADLGKIAQPGAIISPLMDHQSKALYFMLERERNPFEPGVDENFQMWKVMTKDGQAKFFNKALDEYFTDTIQPSLGGILADDMGLGKTLSMLSLIILTLPKAREHAMKPPVPKPNMKGTLIVVPKTLLEANWDKQIKFHIEAGTVKVVAFYGPDRARHVKDLRDADIVLTTYGILEYDNRSHQVLRQGNWFRVVLDEAHAIRSSTTMRAKACFGIEATRRWAITGTPVQNHISDLGSLLTFLRLFPFDNKARFQKYIEQPFRDSDGGVVPRLRIIVDTVLIRRTKENLNLPEKVDELVHVDMTAKEHAKYSLLADHTHKQVQQMTKNRTVMARGTMGRFLRQLLILRMFCAHKQEMIPAQDQAIFKGLSAEDPLCLDDDDEDDENAELKTALDTLAMLRECDHDTCDYCKEGLEILPDGAEGPEAEEAALTDATVIGYMNSCYHVVCRKCGPKLAKEIAANVVDEEKVYYNCGPCERTVRTTITELKRNEVVEFFRRREELRAQPRLAKQLGIYSGPSSKVIYLLNNLKRMRAWNQSHADQLPHKVVVFTYWTTHLDLIEIALQEEGFKFSRLDGRMGHKQRLAAIEQFENDTETVVFLATIGAGGVGLNLTAANYVFIMEPQWNPQAEQQAVDRVHRIGQTRKVRVARLLASDTVEEQIHRMAARKLELAKLTLTKRLSQVDERQAKMKELRDLFRRR